ncbi:hypothetical protein CI102_12170 [Trichoderma harzianum]|nr:hypothetical protein CI102_12170 [Trichoderma harzianum]
MSIVLFLMLILDPFKGIHKVQAKGTRGPSRCTDKVSFGLSLADMDGQTCDEPSILSTPANYPRLANLHSLIQPNERTLPPLPYPILSSCIPSNPHSPSPMYYILALDVAESLHATLHCHTYTNMDRHTYDSLDIPPEERAIPPSLGRRMRKSQACSKGLRAFSQPTFPSCARVRTF